MRIRPISISLSPNVERDDVMLALKLVFSPWRWKRGKAVKELEDYFLKRFKAEYAISFNSGRSSFYSILKSLQIEKDVYLQAFTCNAVPNPVLWAGLNPVYVDCNPKDYNIDFSALKKKFKKGPVIVQHTFGIMADMSQFSDFFVIEDCAHSFERKLQGTAFFSFSRDKIISSVYGGMAITNDKRLGKRIKSFQEELSYPSNFLILRDLLHPVLMNLIILPTYGIFGKYLLVALQHLRILSKAVHKKEKKGKMPSYFPKKMPNALALLALNQLKKVERFNSHRRKMARFYAKNLEGTSYKFNKEGLLRFVVHHPEAHSILKEAWKRNLLIGDWYTSPVAPKDTNLNKMRYSHDCPLAEKLSKTTFNLPTNISIKEAREIINFLKEYDNKRDNL